MPAQGRAKRRIQCLTCRNRAKGAFCRLERRELERLDRSMTANLYRREQIVFFEGNPPFGVYCVSSGRVRLYRTGPDGRSQVVRVAGPGELLGHEALLSGLPFPATAEAIDDSMVCFIEKPAFLRLLEDVPALAVEVARALSRDLMRSQESLQSMTQRPASARLAALLLELDGAAPGSPMRLPRRTLAETVGVAPETAIRILSGFKSRGLIACRGQSLTVLEPGGLARLAEPSAAR
ncbi:MAG: Crp/Fnr family transcriptional regulator [Elusimicrobia bacterium]|nr:Crp/Fnr family transcriptional regulator [Elusimicrobiota bacterium]